jgi:hypothetical protein
MIGKLGFLDRRLISNEGAAEMLGDFWHSAGEFYFGLEHSF